MEFRRTITWVIFIMSGLFIADGWQRYNGQAGFMGVQNRSSTIAATTGIGTDTVPIADIPVTTVATMHGIQPASTASLPTTQTIKIANDVLALEVSTAGGNVVRAELLQHQDEKDANKHVVLLDTGNNPYFAQTGLSGSVAGNLLPNHTAESLFTVVSSNSNSVVLQAIVEGVKLTKTIALTPNSYSVAVTHTVANGSSVNITPSLYLQLVRHGDTSSEGNMITQPTKTFTGPAVYTAESKFQKVTFADIDKQKAKYNSIVKDQEPSWIGMIQHYFVSAWVAKDNKARTLSITPLTVNNIHLYRVTSMQALGVIAPGANVQHEATLYIGPQDQTVLEKLSPGLELVVDYGMLTIIAKPMFAALKFFHTLTDNWGWAIILLTMSIKALLYLPMAMSYRSMAKMKNLAPKIKALQDRYGEDKVKLSSATMELYRTEKINPLGGCLPILFTIPIFIALYSVLVASVEMRNAPWIAGWITNLAVADPWYILPILLAITMIMQFKLNPAPPDPTQAKILMIMQSVFVLMFVFFPAGLNIYYFVNNALSILQQWYITRQLEHEGLQAPAPKKIKK